MKRERKEKKEEKKKNTTSERNENATVNEACACVIGHAISILFLSFFFVVVVFRTPVVLSIK